MEKNAKEMEKELADIIIQRPHEFKVGRKTMWLYPVTLGKRLMLRPYMDALEIDLRMMTADPNVECLRLVEVKKDVCAQILAIHATPNTRKDLFNKSGMQTRRRIMGSLKAEHLAGLLMIVLTNDRTGEIMSHFGIDEERAKTAEVMKVKKKRDSCCLTFGGKTLMGTFIGQLKELGYNDVEIVFEYSYNYLQLMLADKLTTINVSAEELESIPKWAGGKLLDGDDESAMDELAARIKTR